MAPQFITFDTPEQAEQARLHIEASLSVSVVRDYASAARWTLRELMQRYLVEVVPGHKGADVETNRLQRLMRDEPFVDKKLAALAIVVLNDERGNALQSELDGSITYVKGNVADPEDIGRAVAAAEAMGPLRVAVSCAGVGVAMKVVGRENQPHDLATFQKIMRWIRATRGWLSRGRQACQRPWGARC